MFAIVDLAGQQFKVKQNDTIIVHRLEGNEGDSVSAKVLMVANGGSITLNSGTVTGEIVGHFKGDKVITFHKKRRKGYEKTIGHRQSFTKVKINSVA